MSNSPYDFTTTWFQNIQPIWDALFAEYPVKHYLEIGSFEGASACFAIERVKDGGSVTCIDPWLPTYRNSVINSADDMEKVRQRFERNTKRAIDNTAGRNISLKVKPSQSRLALAALHATAIPSFDLIYIDGSHTAPDTLLDLVMSFPLLKAGGIMIMDDYLWHDMPRDVFNPIGTPKLAIDAFTTIYAQQLEILSAPLNQLYIRKR